MLGLVGIVAASILPLGSLLLRPLEERFPKPELPVTVDGIVVLGGSVDPPLSTERGEPALNDAAERLVAAAKLARRYPDARIVFSGGTGRLFDRWAVEVDASREILEALGVDPSRVVWEGRSRNTWENAILSHELADPSSGQTWLLVTSAAHIPRAMGAFRRQGWDVTAFPVDYRTRPKADDWLPGPGFGLAELDRAAREWIGLVVYRTFDRSSALFPRP